MTVVWISVVGTLITDNPVVRTMAPFVAGLGEMNYGRFALYNAAGAVLWIVSLTLAGYLFGNIAWVKQNLTAVFMGIIAILLCLVSSHGLKRSGVLPDERTSWPGLQNIMLQIA